MVTPCLPETIMHRMPIYAFSLMWIGVCLWSRPCTEKYVPYEITALSSIVVMAGSTSSR